MMSQILRFAAFCLVARTLLCLGALNPRLVTARITGGKIRPGVYAETSLSANRETGQHQEKTTRNAPPLAICAWSPILIEA